MENENRTYKSGVDKILGRRVEGKFGIPGFNKELYGLYEMGSVGLGSIDPLTHKILGRTGEKVGIPGFNKELCRLYEGYD